MKITMILNSHKINLDCNHETSLLELLREKNLISVKCGCMKGVCGSCTVLLNGKAVPSCLVKAPLAHNCTVETLEGFFETDDYKDIIAGFEQAGIRLCGFCNAGKIFAAYELMHRKNKKDEIMQLTSSFHCACTEPVQLANGIVYAIAKSHKRMAKAKKEDIWKTKIL